jgi:hypothetical protein
VTDIPAALEHLAAATEVADVLDGAYQAFEAILAVLRRHQDDEVSVFPAFVLAACAAANGRDWTGGAWTQRPDGSEHDTATQLMNGAAIAEVAQVITVASDELAARLSACAETTADDADRDCCEHAAAEAATIGALLGGASPP